MAHAWKVCRRGTVSRVRIPLSPPPPAPATFRARNVPRHGTFGQGRALTLRSLRSAPRGGPWPPRCPPSSRSSTACRSRPSPPTPRAGWSATMPPPRRSGAGARTRARAGAAPAASRLRRCAARRRGVAGGAHPGRGRGSRGAGRAAGRAAGRRQGGLRAPPCPAARRGRRGPRRRRADARGVGARARRTRRRAAGGDRLLVGRRDRRQVARRPGKLVERRCGADLRLDARGDDRPVDHPDHPARAPARGGRHPGAARPRRTHRAFRYRARRQGRTARRGFAERLADPRRHRPGGRRVEDRPRPQPPASSPRRRSAS